MQRFLRMIQSCGICITCMQTFIYSKKIFFTVITCPAWLKGYGVGAQRHLKQRPGPWTCSPSCKWKMIISVNLNVSSLDPHFCDVHQCPHQSQRDFIILSLVIQTMTFRIFIWEILSLSMLSPALLLTWWDLVNLSLEWLPGSRGTGLEEEEQLILLGFVSSGGVWFLIVH